MASNWAQPWRNVQFDATGKPPAGAGIASEILQKRSRRLAMLVAQARQIDSDGRAIDDPPVTADHHPVGLVSATQHPVSYTHPEPTRLGMISYAVFCLKKKKKKR